MRLILTIGIFIFSIAIYGQTNIWTGGNLSVKLSKQNSLKVKTQARWEFVPNSGTTHLYQVGLKQKIGKRWSVTPGYRISFNNVNLKANRIYGDLIYSSKRKKKKFRWDVRLRGQHSIRANREFVNGKTYLRLKPSISYNLSKLVDPFLGYELFYRFNTKNELRELRWIAGLDFKLSKKLNLKTALMNQKEINIGNPSKAMVFVAQLKWKL